MAIRKLPNFLIDGFARWKQTDYDTSSEIYKKLAFEGQNPRVYVIGCCDSRVQTSKIFDADPGDIFVLGTSKILYQNMRRKMYTIELLRPWTMQ